MARTPDDKARLRQWMRDVLLPVWRGQVDDWEAGLGYIADKTGWTPESIEQEIMPWIFEWNRQKDAADKAGKFMAELPNIGVFFRKQKWKNPLPYSFQELRDPGKTEKQEKPCIQCGEPSFNNKMCQRCYTKMATPDVKSDMSENLRRMGFRKQHGETWRDASLRCLKDNGLIGMVPKQIAENE